MAHIPLLQYFSLKYFDKAWQDFCTNLFEFSKAMGEYILKIMVWHILFWQVQSDVLKFKQHVASFKFMYKTINKNKSGSRTTSVACFCNMHFWAWVEPNWLWSWQVTFSSNNMNVPTVHLWPKFGCYWSSTVHVRPFIIYHYDLTSNDLWPWQVTFNSTITWSSPQYTYDRSLVAIVVQLFMSDHL